MCRLHEQLKILISNRKTPGLSTAIIKNGIIMDQLTFGYSNYETKEKLQSNTVLHACSMSKMITALTVLILTERGDLDLDQDVNAKLRSWSYKESMFTKDRKVTLRSLLSHQGGLIDSEGSFGIYKKEYGLPELEDLLNGNTNYHSEPAQIKYEPFSQFEYSDSGYCIIERLLEDVTNKKFEDLVNDLIIKPLNLKNSMYNTIKKTRDIDLAYGHNPDGSLISARPVYPYLAAAGFMSTPTDIAKIINEMFKLYHGKGVLQISKKYVNELFSEQGGISYAGLGVFLDEKDNGLQVNSVGWGNGFQCMLIGYPQEQSGAVVMINQNPGVHQFDSIVGDAINTIINYFNWPN